MPSTAPAVAAPTRWRSPDLMHATDRYADDELDVCLLSWAPGHTTELHEHRWDGE